MNYSVTKFLQKCLLSLEFNNQFGTFIFDKVLKRSIHTAKISFMPHKGRFIEPISTVTCVPKHW